MRELIRAIENYRPACAQEEADRAVMLNWLRRGRDVLVRENRVAHFTASAWIVNPSRKRVLMVYHNIYDSWAWTGGHADGEADLLSVALREAGEETGLKELLPLSREPVSLEILTVNGHVRRGEYVSAHLHMNLTYLLAADDSAALTVKPDENSGVMWMGMDEAVQRCSEPWMRPVYEKLNLRAGSAG